MENRAFGVLAALLLCYVYAPPTAAEPLRVLYAEPFQAQTFSSPGVQKASPSNLRVQAFGRTFELQLEDNMRLLRSTSAQTRERLGAVQLLKGTIKDVPGSWVRLTLSGGRYSGAFWDGAELYAIAPREALGAALLAPMQPAPTAIYRLSDTQGGLLQGTCGVDSSQRANSNPLAKFKALINELRAAADSAFAATPREIDVSMLADFELTNRLGSGTASNLLEKANIVDGIFSSQVGVSTIPTDFVSFAADTDPFTSAEASTLLNELGTYRNNTPLIRGRGLAHLVTGRHLNGSTVGIAYLGSLCEAQFGVSLSESSDFIDSALIMAHELGHNFGAPHDAEPGSSCAATPLGFVMAPQFNNSTTFSTCSVQQMQPHIAAASCVVDSRNRDLAVSGPAAPIQTIVNEAFEVPIDLRSVGDTDAVNIILTVHMPFGLNLLSASLPGGICTTLSDNITLRCELPSLAAGASTRLTLRASHPSASPFGFGIDVISSNDVNSSNDHATVQVDAVSERALRVSTVAIPANVTLGEAFDADFDIAAIGNQTLNNLVIEVFANARATAASIDGGTCNLTPNNGEQVALCTTSSVAPGTPRRLHARFIAERVGETGGQVQAREQSAFSGAFTNFSVHTLPAHDIAVWTDQQDRVTAVGVDAVWPIEVRSVGAFAMDDVHVRFSISQSVDAALEGALAALCTRTSSDFIECDLGTMAAGAVVAGRLRARSNVRTSLGFLVQVLPGLADDDFSNDVLGLNLSVRLPTDVLLTGPATYNLFDQRPATLQAFVEASGANASQDVSVEVSLPAGFSISSARLVQGSCSVQAATPNHATCGRSQLLAGDSAALTVEYQADAPGVYTGSIAVTAREDTDSSNNTRTLTFHVAPAVSGSVQAPPPEVVPTGISKQAVFTLRTNKYALTDARLDFSWFGVLDEFVATAPGAVCAATGNGHRCTFGTIPANSTIPVTVRVRSASATVASINASLFSPAETAFEDNSAFVSYTFLESGDLAVSTSQPSLSGTTNQRVEVQFNTTILSTALDGFVDIDFDAARVRAPAVVNAGACNQLTPPMHCVLNGVSSPGSYPATFSFIPTSAGPLQITLRVGARNDFNSANDQATVTVNVADPPPPPPPPPPPSPSPPSSSSGGGGGGGSMSWLLAALLLLMWHHRRIRSHR
jgi:hypothetical protein